jgi:hypothetical protein
MEMKGKFDTTRTSVFTGNFFLVNDQRDAQIPFYVLIFYL